MSAFHPDFVWTDVGFRRLEDCATGWVERTWHDGHYHSVRETWVCVDEPYGTGKLFAGDDALFSPDIPGFLAWPAPPVSETYFTDVIASASPVQASSGSGSGGGSSFSGGGGGGGGGGGTGGGGGGGTSKEESSSQTSTRVDSGTTGQTALVFGQTLSVPDGNGMTNMIVTPIGTPGLSLMLALALLAAVKSRPGLACLVPGQKVPA